MQEYIDYDTYRLTVWEELKSIGITILLASVAAWILYKSVWGVALGVVIFPVYRKHYVSSRIACRKRELLLQFKDGMQSIAVAIVSGYSIENAWLEAEKEIKELYGEGAFMAEELHQMNSGIRMNQPVEQLLQQFATRSACEDIMGFAEVFRFAKRSGGNFGTIIQNTVHRISEKLETESEIETALSGKKMEQKIMNIVPIFLLAYLNVTSEEFLAPLYGNLFGACVMTLAFVAYVGAFMMAKKMVEIRF